MSHTNRGHDLSEALPILADPQSGVIESYKMVSALYEPFKNKAKDQVIGDLCIFL